MNITSPIDIDSTLASGKDLAASAADTLSTTFDKVEASAGARAAELLDAATTKDGKPKSRTLLVGVLVVVALAVILRRRSR